MSALHGRWLYRSAHAGDVLSAYGAGVAVLGLLLAARPFITIGVRGMAAQQTWAPTVFGYDGPQPAANDAYRARIAAAMKDVWIERVVAVCVIAAGTLLNGWSAALARRWGLPI